MRNDFATVRTLGTRLQVGMKIRLEAGVYEVTLINDCRAHCEPVERTRSVVIEGQFTESGEKKVFKARRRGLDISPNSDVEIL